MDQQPYYGGQVNQVLAHFLTQVATSQHCGDEPGCLLDQPQQQVRAHVAFDGKTFLGPGVERARLLPHTHSCTCS